MGTLKMDWLRKQLSKDGAVPPDNETDENPLAKEISWLKDLAIKSAAFAMAISDLDGKLRYVNPAFLKLWGYDSPDEALGKSVLEFWQVGEEAQEVMEVLRTRGSWVGELVAKSRKGVPFDVQTSASMAIDAAGQQVGMIASFVDITERKRVEKELKSIEWMLSPKSFPNTGGKVQDLPGKQGYGDLTELNREGIILRSIGKELLKEIVAENLYLLGTSSAIYEKNGDYACGIFSSNWCQLMDDASRNLCKTYDNSEALKSGKWLCHESCWSEASKLSMLNRAPVDIECRGGIRICAVPIFASGEAIGSINIGYGDPPKDPTRLRELATQYNASYEDLLKEASSYQSRPTYIVEMAKKRLHSTARLIGFMVESAKAEDAVRSINTRYLQTIVLNGLIGWVAEADGQVKDIPAWRKFTGQSIEEEKGWGWLDAIHPDDREHTTRAWEKAIKSRSAYETECRIRRHDGVYQHFISRSVPVPNDKGGIREWVGVCIDITERKRVEKLLLEANDRLETTVAERTAELQKKVEELERFRKATIEREFRIKELRDELDRLQPVKRGAGKNG